MAYSTDSPPVLLLSEPMGAYSSGRTAHPAARGTFPVRNGRQVWSIRSASTLAVMTGATGFITNGEELGMKVGDVIYATDNTAPASLKEYHLLVGSIVGGKAVLRAFT